MEEKRNMQENETKVNMEETFKAMMNAMFENQTLYFELVEKVTEKKNYTDMMSKRLMKMKLTDQIKVLKLMADLADVAEDLCKKYGLEVEER